MHDYPAIMDTPVYKSKVPQKMTSKMVLMALVRGFAYASFSDFLAELRLPFENCLSYGVNTLGPAGDVLALAEDFLQFIDREARQIEQAEEADGKYFVFYL